MSVWRDVVGQPELVARLSAVAGDPRAMTHAWLLTGPPGSGRSVAARAFAAALECPDGGCGDCRECRTALDGSHADVEIVNTEGLTIKVETARQLVQLAARAPSVGRWRVILIEDVDRLSEQAANALLKALEEPSPRTVWLLCAPSLEDVIITVRSRSRHLRLRIPPVDAVAELLVRRDGIDPAMAHYAARAAQSHVGMARRLARDEGARNRRHDILRMAGAVTTLGDALREADRLHTIARAEADASSDERDAAEKAALLGQLGAEAGARTQPPAIRAQVRQLEEEQKRRRTRHIRDVIDRSLTDLASIYRDALVTALGHDGELVNASMRAEVDRLARTQGPERLLLAIDAIGLARTRIDENVAPLLALEAMMISLQAGQRR